MEEQRQLALTTIRLEDDSMKPNTHTHLRLNFFEFILAPSNPDPFPFSRATLLLSSTGIRFLIMFKL